MKNLTKSWSDIYKTFARLAALVTNVDSNECGDEICQRCLKILKSADIQVHIHKPLIYCHYINKYNSPLI